MLRTLMVLLVCVPLALAGEDKPPLPPSPSTAPGVRIWPDPHFTHWPAIAYEDEVRNIAFQLPVKQAGVTGTIGWLGGEQMPITLPAEADAISGLLALPLTAGEHVATCELGSARFPLRVRVVSARDAWPFVRLVGGFPVDAQGVPIVLLDRRRGTREERMWSWLDGSAPRPTGRPVIIGDDLEAMGQTAWDGMDATTISAGDIRYPHHAVLTVLAGVLRDGATAADLPRSIFWCPGNQALYGAAWSAEEERVMGAIIARCEALKIAPRLVICLPPHPVEEQWHKQAAERHSLLQQAASRLGWAAVDFAAAAGDPTAANQVSPGVFTRYPVGAAQERIRQALKAALAR